MLLRALTLLLALALVAAACGGDDDDDTTSTTNGGSETTDAGNGEGAEGTRVVSTPRGDVEVPAAPERIVALDPFATLQTLDDLGAPLVAAGSLAGGERKFVSEATAALPAVGMGTELDHEAIAAARPDLIIGLESYGDDYDILSEIAPTVLVELGDWRDVVRSIADAAGLSDDADAAVGAIDDRVAELAAELEADADAPTSISLVRVPSGGDVRVYTSRWRNIAASALLSDLGLEMTGDGLSDDDVSYVEVSPELLGDLDADVIVFYGGGGVLDADEAVDELEAQPLWQRIPAVADGRAQQVDADLWFSATSPTAVSQLLDDIERVLTGS